MCETLWPQHQKPVLLCPDFHCQREYQNNKIITSRVLRFYYGGIVILKLLNTIRSLDAGMRRVDRESAEHCSAAFDVKILSGFKKCKIV